MSFGVSVWLGAEKMTPGERDFARLNLMLYEVWLSLPVVIARLYGKLSAEQGATKT